MLATIESATVIGVDACRVQVEIDVSRGFPTFQLVGLPDASIRESRDRVRAAMRNCSYDFPISRITINLAPGDVRKAGPAFDLPIAVGILKATGIVTRDDFAGLLQQYQSLAAPREDISIGRDPALLLQQLAALATLLSDSDMAATDRFAELLETHDRHWADDLQPLSAAVATLDFERAFLECRKLMDQVAAS